MKQLCRSALYMPGINERALAKGPQCRADAVIVDLEDSVAPEAKSIARDQASHALRNYNYGDRLRVLRINAADSPWQQDDIDCAIACQPDALLVPKIDHAEQVHCLVAVMDNYPRLSKTRLWCMMESPASVVNASAIAGVRAQHQRLGALIIGNNDMAKLAGMPMSQDRRYLIPWMMTVVAAAKANELIVLDGVYNQFSDLAGLSHECQEACQMGMDGKTLIHPCQINTANEAFAPSVEAIQQARAIVSAFADPSNAKAAVVQIDGRMVERLHLDIARQTLARAVFTEDTTET